MTPTDDGDTALQTSLREKANSSWLVRFEGDDVDQIYFELIVASLRENTRLVDVGCGTGDFLSLIARDSRICRLASATGVDNSLHMLESATRRFGSERPLRWLKGDHSELPLPPESQDIVLSRLADFTPREVARVLASRGLFVEYGLGPADSKEIARAFGVRYLCDYQESGHSKWYDFREKSLSDVGLATRRFTVYSRVDFLTEQQMVDTVLMVPLVRDFDPVLDIPTLQQMPKKRVGESTLYTVSRQITLRVAVKDAHAL